MSANVARCATCGVPGGGHALECPADARPLNSAPFRRDQGLYGLIELEPRTYVPRARDVPPPTGEDINGAWHLIGGVLHVETGRASISIDDLLSAVRSGKIRFA